jgi:hypothetical protein
MTRIPLTALAFIAINLLANLSSSIAQLSTPSPTLTLSETHAWDPSAALPTNADENEYIRKAPAPELPPPKRVGYFVRHLNSGVQSIAADALHEVSLAGVKHIATLSSSDTQLLRAYIVRPTAKDEFRAGLDRLIAGYLLAEGASGLEVFEESLFKDKERQIFETYAGLQALRFIWSRNDGSIQKERMRQTLRTLLDRPQLADLVIADLAKWEGWSVQDELMSLYGTEGFKAKLMKRAIIRYMLKSTQAAPADQVDNIPKHVAKGRTYLDTLKKRDPRIYKNVLRFGFPHRPPAEEPKQGRDDSRGDYAAVASSLSGFRIYTTAIHNIAFSPDGDTLLSGSGDGTVRWWDVESGLHTKTVNAHSVWCFSIAIHPDGEMIATGGGDQLVKLWRIENRTPFATLAGHTDDVHAVAYDPTGRKLFSAGDDMSVVVFDLKTLKLIQRMRGHTAPIPTLAVSPDGSVIATGSRDDTIRLWDATTGMQRQLLKGHAGDVHSVCFSPNGEILASASYDETVKLWNVETGELVNTLGGHTNWVFSIAFHPAGKLLASGDKDGRVILWDLNSGKEVAALKRQRHVSCVAFSPDGTILASSSPSATICLWDPHSKTLRKTLEVTPPEARPKR